MFLGSCLLAAFLLAVPGLAAGDDKKDKDPVTTEKKEKDPFHPAKASTAPFVESHIAKILEKGQPEGVEDLKAIQDQV